jgi:hypothetical protein
MKFLGVIVFFFMSLPSFAHPRDSTRVAQRERARMERRNLRSAEKEKAKLERVQLKEQREREQIIRKWDQRTMTQRRKDRQVLFFLVAGAALLVSTMTSHE